MRIPPSAIAGAVGAVGAIMLTLGSPVSTQSGGTDAPYFIADVGTFGGTESAATAINESSQLAGWARRGDGAQHAFFFDTTLHDLGTIGGPSSAASGVNRVGTVVGQSLSAILNTKGFIYQNGVRRSLGTFGGSDSAAYAVSDDGDVVGGASTTNNAATRAFLYRSGTMKSLGTLGGSDSVATAINGAGEIAGFSTLAAGSSRTHAFLYRNGAMTDLGTLGTDSEAWGINLDGSVVGKSTLASGDSHAFLWRGGAMMDLGTLGGRHSVAKSIDDFFSAVVGESEIAGGPGTHAFLYQNGVMTDLNTRLRPGSGWVLESANAINSVGEIAGVGTINGQRHGFLLMVPVGLELRNVGIFDSDSNLPTGGVQVGRSVTFVTSVSLSSDEGIAHRVVFTDTISGPVTIESVRTARGSACSVAGNVVTCRMPQLGELTRFAPDEEIDVTVRLNAPGAFSHTAHATADNAVPSPKDTESETNTAIALKAFTLSAATVAGGTAVSARAELTSLAPRGGAVVHLESSNPAIAPVPAPFVVQLPTAVRTFNIIPPVVSEPTAVTITASYGLVTISQTLTVVPPALKTLSLTRSTMIGSCQKAIARVTLTGDAPAAGANVVLTSTTAGVHVPSTLTIAPGETSTSVTVTADAVHERTTGTFTAAFGGVTRQLPLAVRPIFVTAVTLTPPQVTGGAPSSGAATLECPAPAGGLTATLTSTNPSVAAPTAGSAMFAGGSTTAAFQVGTSQVAATTTPSIRVTVNGVTKSAALTVEK